MKVDELRRDDVFAGKEWAEEGNRVPATVEGTEHCDHLGVLRIYFGDADTDVQKVSWDEWFKTFDDRGLNFIYQSAVTAGSRTSSVWRTPNARMRNFGDKPRVETEAMNKPGERSRAGHGLQPER